jgi:putative membrane-bound dehydrogenase-like protein
LEEDKVEILLANTANTIFDGTMPRPPSFSPSPWARSARPLFGILMLGLISPLVVAQDRGADKKVVGNRLPTEEACPTVEAAIEKMTVPEGYRVVNFAAEPLLRNPIAMTWDEKGRLWVLEGLEYPNGSKHPAPFCGEVNHDNYQPVPDNCQGKEDRRSAARQLPRDRVVILEDTDGDGVADKRTIFLEGLNLGSALLVGDGGLYVGQQPHLLHFADTDGDDHADLWKVLLTGFGRQDTHETINSFTWGPEGWLYMTHGVFTHSSVRKPGQPKEAGMKFDAGIGRMKIKRERRDGQPFAEPTDASFEVYADGTSNPWGVDFDKSGNAFIEACVIDHLFHMAPGGLYARQGGAPAYPYAYELLPSIVGKDHPRHHRAAFAGISVYNGGIYPNDTQGHLFFGNIHDNSIHEEKVVPVGSSFRAEPVRDFLRANNGWFRPVSVQTGPDGHLWIMDWCDKYPCYQNAVANPEGVDRERGRIWRVVWGDKTGLSPTGLSPSDTKALVKALESKNSWTRMHARRLIREQTHLLAGSHKEGQAPGVVLDFLAAFPPIPELIKKNTNPELILEHLLVRDNVFINKGWPGFDVPLQATGASDSELLRIWSARLIGDDPTESNKSLAKKLASDPSPAVRLALAASLRKFGENQTLTTNAPAYLKEKSTWEFPREIHSVLVAASAKDADQTLAFVIWTGLEPWLAQNPEAVFPLLQEHASKGPLLEKLFEKSLRRICDTRDATKLAVALDSLKLVSKTPTILQSGLRGLVAGQENAPLKPQNLATISADLQGWSEHENPEIRKLSDKLSVLWGNPAMVAKLVKVSQDANAPLDERLQSMQTLRQLKAPETSEAIRAIFMQKSPESLRIEAIRTIPVLEEDLGLLLPMDWEQETPVTRAAIAEALISRPAWAADLLDAAEGKGRHPKPIPLASIPTSIRRWFANDAPAPLKERAEKILGKFNEGGDDIKKLITQKRQVALQGDPDLVKGKTIYNATCAVCHKFQGQGIDVGPDLTANGRSSLDALLNNVIHPDQIIGRGYENYSLLTTDGRTITGRLIEDTPTQVTLLGIAGAKNTIPREQIKELKDTGHSLMPQGFGALPDSDLRDLLWYVLAPPEDGPLTPEKKAALSAPVTELIAEKQPAKGVDFPKPQRHNKDANPDRESAALWNPEWQINAPDFEATPTKLADFMGRKNVLITHPFPDDANGKGSKTPASLSRKVKIPEKGATLTAVVAAFAGHDWEFRVRVEKEVIHQQIIPGSDKEWQIIEVDLKAFAGKEITLQLENAATDWSWEFAYWGEVSIVGQ